MWWISMAAVLTWSNPQINPLFVEPSSVEITLLSSWILPDAVIAPINFLRAVRYSELSMKHPRSISKYHFKNAIYQFSVYIQTRPFNILKVLPTRYPLSSSDRTDTIYITHFAIFLNHNSHCLHFYLLLLVIHSLISKLCSFLVTAAPPPQWLTNNLIWTEPTTGQQFRRLSRSTTATAAREAAAAVFLESSGSSW